MRYLFIYLYQESGDSVMTRGVWYFGYLKAVESGVITRITCIKSDPQLDATARSSSRLAGSHGPMDQRQTHTQKRPPAMIESLFVILLTEQHCICITCTESIQSADIEWSQPRRLACCLCLESSCILEQSTEHFIFIFFYR